MITDANEMNESEYFSFILYKNVIALFCRITASSVWEQTNRVQNSAIKHRNMFEQQHHN